MSISIQSSFPSLSLSPPPPPSKENAWGGTRREVVAGLTVPFVTARIHHWYRITRRNNWKVKDLSRTSETDIKLRFIAKCLMKINVYCLSHCNAGNKEICSFPKSHHWHLPLASDTSEQVHMFNASYFDSTNQKLRKDLFTRVEHSV